MRIVARAAAAAAILVFSVLASEGCSSSSAGVKCTPGQMLQCTCSGMLSGMTVCDSTGQEAPCQCAGGSGSGSGGTSSGGSGGSSGGTGSSSGGTVGEGGTGGGEGGTGAGDATTDGAGGIGDGGAG